MITEKTMATEGVYTSGGSWEIRRGSINEHAVAVKTPRFSATTDVEKIREVSKGLSLSYRLFFAFQYSLAVLQGSYPLEYVGSSKCSRARRSPRKYWYIQFLHRLGVDGTRNSRQIYQGEKSESIRLGLYCPGDCTVPSPELDQPSYTE